MHALRVSLVVGLLVTFAAPAAASDTQGVATFLDEVKSFFASLWDKSGCWIDPLGHCVTNPQTKTGCRIDPWGGCIETPQTKEGCWIDPLGRCVMTPPLGSASDRPGTTGPRQLDRE